MHISISANAGPLNQYSLCSRFRAVGVAGFFLMSAIGRKRTFTDRHHGQLGGSSESWYWEADLPLLYLSATEEHFTGLVRRFTDFLIFLE